MRVLLVNPPVSFSYHSLGIRRPPLGLAYIASVLQKHHEVKIVDFSVERWDWSRYPYGQFGIVGISVDTPRYPVSLRIARLAKDQGAVVVMGGPHVSFLDRDALKSGTVDYVVRNEGEYPFLSLVNFLSKQIPFDEVTGVSYSTNGELSKTPDARLPCDLDSLPFPARRLLPLQLYRENREKAVGRLMTTLITSRGCPFNCNFCSSSHFFGVRWRVRSVENILEEIELLTMSRVDDIARNPDMFRIRAKAGFRWTFLGFESSSQEVLNGYGKRMLVENGPRAMEILRENNVRVTGSFILGALNETRDMIKQTISFAKLLNPSRAQFSILTPYPGTRLYEEVKDRLLTQNWEIYTGVHPTIKLRHLSSEELRRLLIMAYFSFYGRPRKAFECMPYLYKVIPNIIRPPTAKPSLGGGIAQ